MYRVIVTIRIGGQAALVANVMFVALWLSMNRATLCIACVSGAGGGRNGQDDGYDDDDDRARIHVS